MRINVAILFAFVALLPSCKEAPTTRLLSDVETYIQSRPDSALSTLQAIPENTLGNEADWAKYSLLLAMALDKNYIDTTDANVIAPAIDFYKHHGKAYYKFMSNYYLGRIYENAGINKEAMAAMLKAEEYIRHAPIEYHTKLYAAKGRIYISEHHYKLAEQETKKTLLAAEKSGDDHDIGTSLLDLATLSLILRDSISSEKYINQYEDRFSLDFAPLKQYYTRTILANTYFFGVCDSTSTALLTEYVQSPNADLLICFLLYFKMGNYPMAEEVLEKYEANNPESLESDFYYCRYLLDNQRSNSSETLKSLYKYMEVQDAENLKIFEDELAMQEERHKGEIREQHFLYWGILSAILLLSAIIYLALENKHRKREYKLLENEYNSIQQDIQLIQNAHSDRDAEQFRKQIEHKITALAALLEGEKQNDTKSAIKTLALHSKDKNDIISMVVGLTSIDSEQFCSYLRKNGLSEFELGICCLMLIGFNTKELPDIVGKKNVYNIYSAIRSKLGMSAHDTNLPIRIKQIYQEIN